MNTVSCHVVVDKSIFSLKPVCFNSVLHISQYFLKLLKVWIFKLHDVVSHLRIFMFIRESNAGEAFSDVSEVIFDVWHVLVVLVIRVLFS